MDNDICLPFVKKWRKYSETLGSMMLLLYHFVLAWRVTLNRRICGSNLDQVDYTLYFTLETAEYLYLSYVGWHIWIVKQLGRQTKESKLALQWV